MDVATSFNLFRRQQNKQEQAQTTSNSASSLVSTLVPTILIAAAIFVAFLFLRRKLGRVYQPRSYDGIVERDAQTPPAKKSFFGWISDFRQLPDDHILRHQSLDGYFFVRYLKMLAIISFVGCCLTWPVLFPVNATGHGGQHQLDILSMSNIANPNRYYAQAIIAWIFLGFVLFVVVKESLYFIGVRQAFFMSSLHAQRLPSRTVLFLGIPEDRLSEQALRETFGSHVRKIWIVPDCKELEEALDDRDTLWNKFEAGEQSLIADANKKAKEKGANFNQADPLSIVDKKDWPTHRLKMLIGKKVNTIEYGRTELPNLTRKIEELQVQYFDGHSKLATAAFIEFSSQAAAQEAMQFTEKHKTKFSPRYIQVDPEQVIWKNLSMSKASRKTKMALATTVIVLLTIFWAIPVAFVGILTNINYLTNEVPFLSFINKIPSVILGVVTGLLPVVLLAVLMMLVPIICRLLAKFAGAPTLAAVESKTQTWYFIFQVIQVFLITTFTSAASSVASQIVQNPAIAVSLLAENLPKASNFYISYFILQGLMIFALQLLNVVPLLMIHVLGKFTDKTPRKQFNRWTQLVGLGWGSEYPKITNMGVIMLSYSCIAPLVLGFATIGFALMYLGYRYQFLFVLGLKVDMNGEAYLKGIRQLLTGVYLATWCLIGLFAIAVAKSNAAIGPLVLMVVFLIVLIVCHVLVVAGLKPLEDNIPLDLLADNPASRIMSSDAEEGHGYDSDDTRADPNAQHDQRPPHHHHTSTANAAPANVNTVASAGYNNKHAPNAPPQEWQPRVSAEKRKQNFLTRRFENAITSHRIKAASRLGSHQADPNEAMEKLATNTATSSATRRHNDAYLHPALATTRNPIVWLARDELGCSRQLAQGNKEVGIDTSDEMAWLDEQGKVQWEGKDDGEKMRKLPIWQEKGY